MRLTQIDSHSVSKIKGNSRHRRKDRSPSPSLFSDGKRYDARG